MMNRKEYIEYCLTFPSAFEDYPFNDENWAIMKAGNKKMFAAIYDRNNFLQLNLKCEPMQADFLRSVYKSITPTYHMNKTHWNTVTIDGSVPDDEIFEMITHSFQLVK
jgi:predicted DNA-binding protein (MmcQ/YjbR family)